MFNGAWRPTQIEAWHIDIHRPNVPSTYNFAANVIRVSFLNVPALEWIFRCAHL